MEYNKIGVGNHTISRAIWNLFVPAQIQLFEELTSAN